MTEPAAPAAYLPVAPVTSVPAVSLPADRPIAPLGMNESAFGASPRAVQAAQARAARLWSYPDPSSAALRAAIGRVHGLDPAGLVCGNGSEELLDVLARLYTRPGDELLFPQYGFMQFPVVAMRTGATAVRAPEAGYTTDVDALLACITPRTKLVFVANPNNPTGTTIGRDALRRLVEGVPPRVVLALDAAYAEYVTTPDYDAGHGFVAGRDNVIVLRTLSKAYGLAALRVGWAHGPAAMVALMNQVRGVGNVNAVAQAAAVAALEDQAFLRDAVARTATAREALGAHYRELGLEPLPSQANFFALRFPPQAACTARQAHEHLARQGIWVRPLADCGMPDFLRITVGHDADNARLLAALTEVFGRQAPRT